MNPGVPEIIELPLSGVDSGHCALIVDKKPGNIDGINKHKAGLRQSQNNYRNCG
jgi:hypothetical protein